MTFEDAVEIIIEKEGGEKITHDPDDSGGVTKFGISKKSYPDLDIENLTKEEAIEIYRQDFWNEIRGDELPDLLRLSMFDCAVNQGVKAAIGMLQATISLKVDGALGPKTMSRLNDFSAFIILQHFNVQRLRRYARHPKFYKFGEGWSVRVMEITFETFKGK